jgi:hypothetical protein
VERVGPFRLPQLQRPGPAGGGLEERVPADLEAAADLRELGRRQPELADVVPGEVMDVGDPGGTQLGDLPLASPRPVL